jgi:hypothetical protein
MKAKVPVGIFARYPPRPKREPGRRCFQPSITNISPLVRSGLPVPPDRLGNPESFVHRLALSTNTL